MPPSTAATFRSTLLSTLVVAAGACTDANPAAPGPTAPAFDLQAESLADPGVFTGNIRIGVVQAAATVRLGGTGAFVVRDRQSGAELLQGQAEELSVSLATVPVIRRVYYLQVACASNTAAGNAVKDQWLADAAAAGYRTITEFVPAANCTRLRIGELPEAQYLNNTTRAAWRAEVTNRGLNLANGTAFFLYTFQEGITQFRIQRGSTATYSTGAPRVEAVDGQVLIDGRPYRGTGEVGINAAGSLAGINELPLEAYLYGVVPRELGPTVYPEVEAQKAQAVAARTYALLNFRKRLADGYNLRATTDDQVYGGYQDEHPVSNAAVDATTGIVATYDGRLISTYYSSTSGGYTASFEEWLDGAIPVPYLTGVPDAQRGKAFEHVPSLEVFRNHANPASLRNVREGDWESNWSRYHRWVAEWSAAEIRQVISAFAQRDVGRVLEINVLERGPSGRVLVIEYVTEQGTFTSTRNGIRGSLKFIGSAGTPTNLLSTLFFIEPVEDRRTGEIGFKAYGGGFGHGVGLSQTGAVGMAEKGRSYEEILKHYYQGIELRREY